MLSITEMTPYLKCRFEPRICEVCEQQFTMNGKYITSEDNHHNVCSSDCYTTYKQIQTKEDEYNHINNSYVFPPTIYKIENIITNQIYVGKTIRSFTLRWWEHIKSGKLAGDKINHKFYKAIHDSNITDWIYSVIEVIKYPNQNMTTSEKESYILERESYWINKYNSINEGYNSVISKI